MDYYRLGDKIEYDGFNALVYLLRRFKRLTSDLKISKTISSDYGDYTITGGLTSVGGNFILEDDVTISSTNVLRNCFYTFNFTVIDVNLSGTVNKRIMSVTGDTGDNGLLEVVLEPSLLESDEVLLPEFSVDIVFDPHEYYTPVSVLDITLESDKRFVSSGEVATVTATVLDEDGEPLEDLTLQFNVNGVLYSRVTDENGQAFYEYTGTGVSSRIEVSVSGVSLVIYDVAMVATVKNKVILGNSVLHPNWLISNGDVVIDWGDGTTSTVNNPTQPLTHNYTDGETEHTIVFIGEITGLGEYCFYHVRVTSVFISDTVTSLGNRCFSGCVDLTSITVPNSVTSIGEECFRGCGGLTSVVIPNSVTSMGNNCFQLCPIVDYQLYWKDTAIIEYNSDIMPVNSNTYFTIPYGQTSNYTGKNYPSSKLVERSAPIHTYSLSIASDKSSILTTESVTLSGQLLMDSSPYASQSVALYDGSTLISTLTTDSDGEYEEILTGLSVGTHTFKAVNSNVESSTVSVTVTEPTPVHDYSLTLASTKDILSYADSESATVTATLTYNSVAVAGETLNYVIKHGATTISTGSDTTDSNGEISFTYSATGIGDVDIEVSYSSLLQETYEVIDYISYDDATTDKASKYIIANLNSHTFSTDHYVAERTLSASASATYYSLVHETYNLPTDFEASVDLLVTNKLTSDHQFGLCISPDYPETYSGTNQCFLYSNRNRFALGYRINGTLSNYGAYNSDFSTNTWYTFYIKVQGTTVTTTIKQGSNTIQSYTGTHSNIQSWKKLMLVIGGNSNNMYWKNIKVKAL